MAGSRIKNFFFDIGLLQTKYKFEQSIPSKTLIVSGAYTWNRLLLNLAYRNEESAAPQFNYSNNSFEWKKNKRNYYGGIQYAINRFIILGTQYNYFLMKDVSFSATVFF
jgi:hypothetical protein